MGNDNEDRRNPMRTVSLITLEEQVNELYGPSVFDWTIGKVGPDEDDPIGTPAEWFYYGGTETDPVTQKTKWRVGGHAQTAAEAMLALIREHDGG
jgi:hypothetical protein